MIARSVWVSASIRMGHDVERGEADGEESEFMPPPFLSLAVVRGHATWRRTIPWTGVSREGRTSGRASYGTAQISSR